MSTAQSVKEKAGMQDAPLPSKRLPSNVVNAAQWKQRERNTTLIINIRRELLDDAACTLRFFSAPVLRVEHERLAVRHSQLRIPLKPETFATLTESVSNKDTRACLAETTRVHIGAEAVAMNTLAAWFVGHQEDTEIRSQTDKETVTYAALMYLTQEAYLRGDLNDFEYSALGHVFQKTHYAILKKIPGQQEAFSFGSFSTRHHDFSMLGPDSKVVTRSPPYMDTVPLETIVFVETSGNRRLKDPELQDRLEDLRPPEIAFLTYARGKYTAVSYTHISHDRDYFVDLENGIRGYTYKQLLDKYVERGRVLFYLGGMDQGWFPNRVYKSITSLLTEQMNKLVKYFRCKLDGCKLHEAGTTNYRLEDAPMATASAAECPLQNIRALQATLELCWPNGFVIRVPRELRKQKFVFACSECLYMLDRDWLASSDVTTEYVDLVSAVPCILCTATEVPLAPSLGLPRASGLL